MKFIIFKDEKDEWRWRLIAKNNRITASAGEGFKTRGGVEKSIQTILSALREEDIAIETARDIEPPESAQ